MYSNVSSRLSTTIACLSTFAADTCWHLLHAAHFSTRAGHADLYGFVFCHSHVNMGFVVILFTDCACAVGSSEKLRSVALLSSPVDARPETVWFAVKSSSHVVQKGGICWHSSCWPQRKSQASSRFRSRKSLNLSSRCALTCGGRVSVPKQPKPSALPSSCTSGIRVTHL